MALNRKYSALPDLDTAPDIYETPELTDDNSTVLTTTGRSPSDESDDNDDDDDVDTGISRSRVQVDQARSRFVGSTVDARGVDFSDRVDGKRKSYRTATSARRRRRQQQAVLGDVSDEDGEGNENGDDDDDDEDSDSPDGLERKIARLKREVEEAKLAYSRQKAEAAAAKANAKGAAPGTAAGRDLDSLSQVLDDIARLADEQAATTTRSLATVPPTAAPAESASSPSPSTSAPAPSAAGAHALAQTADFDRRLVLLERSIGIEGGDGAGLPRAILPTLDALQRQIGTLADASTASLDGIARRVRTLAQEADQLAKARQAAKAAQEALADVTGGKATDGPGHAAKDASRDDGDGAKINALYGTLPTIEQLAPLLPQLLDRLRSLRAIHADAAGASELLDALAQQQADTAAEVRQWRQGLDTMEAALRDGETTMGKNAQVMEGWVKGLEARLDKLA
ncbi:dynactin 2 [Sporothrix brasiliensis 5110]|uniref:Dynactin 2 n=1 Tax=Sporothrix brasiliensis 5110 TaxID=1398154 RepID=A0A0C2FL14_9PEZI|nr:dynactin 2 [Sporothrix brasiliensis 5110]KIH91768.1 dynactin 2 [Sporothrix brasiliensis 5110]